MLFSNSPQVGLNAVQRAVAMHDRAKDDKKWLLLRVRKPSLIHINKTHEFIPIQGNTRKAKRTIVRSVAA